jgi:hypothetical protein
MLLQKVLRQVVSIVQSIAKNVKAHVKAWTKPATDSLIGGTAADFVLFYDFVTGGCIISS